MCVVLNYKKQEDQNEADAFSSTRKKLSLTVLVYFCFSCDVYDGAKSDDLNCSWVYCYTHPSTQCG